MHNNQQLHTMHCNKYGSKEIGFSTFDIACKELSKDFNITVLFSGPTAQENGWSPEYSSNINHPLQLSQLKV